MCIITCICYILYYSIIVGRGVLTPPYYMKICSILLSPSPIFFFKFCSNPPPPFLCRLWPPFTRLFLLFCSFGWMGDRATFHALFCFIVLFNYTCRALVPQSQKGLDVSFMQQGVKITDFWHIMCFFAGTLICYHTLTQAHTQTHKDTQHTQWAGDWHSHINICLHHLLYAHSSYRYYNE